jgi:hypothetical protein
MVAGLRDDFRSSPNARFRHPITCTTPLMPKVSGAEKAKGSFVIRLHSTWPQGIRIFSVIPITVGTQTLLPISYCTAFSISLSISSLCLLITLSISPLCFCASCTIFSARSSSAFAAFSLAKAFVKRLLTRASCCLR